MVFWFCLHILEDALLPESLHQIPIIDSTMSNRILHRVSLRICYGFIADEEIKVLDAALGREMAGFGCDWRSTRSRLSGSRGMFTRSYSSRKHAKLWLGIARLKGTVLLTRMGLNYPQT